MSSQLVILSIWLFSTSSLVISFNYHPCTDISADRKGDWCKSCERHEGLSYLLKGLLTPSGPVWAYSWIHHCHLKMKSCKVCTILWLERSDRTHNRHNEFMSHDLPGPSNTSRASLESVYNYLLQTAWLWYRIQSVILSFFRCSLPHTLISSFPTTDTSNTICLPDDETYLLG